MWCEWFIRKFDGFWFCCPTLSPRLISIPNCDFSWPLRWQNKSQRKNVCAFFIQNEDIYFIDIFVTNFGVVDSAKSQHLVMLRKFESSSKRIFEIVKWELQFYGLRWIDLSHLSFLVLKWPRMRREQPLSFFGLNGKSDWNVQRPMLQNSLAVAYGRNIWLHDWRHLQYYIFWQICNSQSKTGQCRFT